MAKKIFKRSLALGALMAFVITGNAFAASLYNDVDLLNKDLLDGKTIVIDSTNDEIDKIYTVQGVEEKISGDLNVNVNYSDSQLNENFTMAAIRLVDSSGLSMYGDINYNILGTRDFGRDQNHYSDYFTSVSIYCKDTEGNYYQKGDINLIASGLDRKLYATRVLRVNGNAKVQLDGDANITLENVTGRRLQVVSIIDNATVLQNGDVNLIAKGYIDEDRTCDAITGYWVQESDVESTLNGDINMSFINGKISKNIYGVAIKQSTLNHNGDININFAGQADEIFAQSAQTIYGYVDIPETSTSNRGYVQNDNGKKRVVFGVVNDSGDIEPFISGKESPFKWSFANFDEVQIKKGSTLVIDSSQNDDVEYEHSGYADFVLESNVNKIENKDLISCYGGNLNLRGNALTIEDKASATMQNLNSENGATVTLGNDAKLIVEKELGDGAVNFVVASLAKDQVKVGTAEVIHTAETSSDNLGKDLEKGLENLRMVATDKDNNSIIKKVVGTEGAVYDRVTAEFDNEGNIVDINKTIAAANYSIGEMYSVALMAWRAENNDMHKRLGELRDANGEHGVWARMTRGESEYKSVKNQYNAYQLGYDQKTGDWTVGAAVSYTEGETSFAKGNGENDHTGLAVYGSKLNKDGSYIDLIAKYANLDHEYTARGGIGSGKYDTDGFAWSAEYGKRFDQGNGLWIEPQVELTYGLVDSVDFEAENGRVSLDNMNSLVGRVGFRAGKDIKDGNVYARASYLYDFEGETDITFNDMETITQDLGGGWWEVGVGANINLSKATYIYADVEKTFGGEVDTNWQWNLGVRYSF